MCNVSITALAALAAAAAGLNLGYFQGCAGSATTGNAAEPSAAGDSENGRVFGIDQSQFFPPSSSLADMPTSLPPPFSNNAFGLVEPSAATADEIPRQDAHVTSERLQETSPSEDALLRPSGDSEFLEGAVLEDLKKQWSAQNARTEEEAAGAPQGASSGADDLSSFKSELPSFDQRSQDGEAPSLPQGEALDADDPPDPLWVGEEVARLRARKDALPLSLVLSYAVEGCVPAANDDDSEEPKESTDSRDSAATSGGGLSKSEEGVLFGQEARYAAISSLHQRVSRLLQQKRATKYSEALSPASDLLAAASGAGQREPAQTPAGGLETKYLSALQMEIIKKVPAGLSASDLLSVTEDLPCVQRRFRDELKFIEEPPDSAAPLSAADSASPKSNRRLQSAPSPFAALSAKIIASTREAEGRAFAEGASGTVPPNDPAFPLQWNLRDGGGGGFGINAEKAWRLWSGIERPVVIAVIDSGCDLDHPDLRDKLWVNPGEICGDGIDNDGNGYVDDCHGWDFVRNRGTVVGGSSGHGTGASGVLGSASNNLLGVAGVCWGCRIMCLAFIGKGEGSVSHQVQAIDYAVMMGAWISNNSYGGYGKSELEFEAIQRAQRAGHLFVASAGNHNLNTDLPQNDHTPSTYPLSNLVSVGAATPEGHRAAFSNYGARTVHLFAPGTAGAAGLVWSAFPTLTYVEVKRALMEGCKPSAQLAGLSVCGGTLDLYRALAVAAHIAGGVPVDWRSLQQAADKTLVGSAGGAAVDPRLSAEPSSSSSPAAAGEGSPATAKPVGRVSPLSGGGGLAGPIGALFELGIWPPAQASSRSTQHVTEAATDGSSDEAREAKQEGGEGKRIEEAVVPAGVLLPRTQDVASQSGGWGLELMQQMQSHVEQARLLLDRLAVDLRRQRLRQGLGEQTPDTKDITLPPSTFLAETARAALGAFPLGLTDVF